MQLKVTLLSVLLLFFLASCGTGKEVLSTVSPLVSPLESPVLATDAFAVVCSPANTSCGAIKGVLYLQSGQPAVGSILYLGEYVGLDTVNPLVVLDSSKHLHVQTDDKGQFCFPEVPPGTYSLIVWDAVESVLLNDPATGYSLLLEVKTKETIDTGVLYSPMP